MTKEKLESLKKYVLILKNKLSEHTNQKHKHNIKTYHEFLHLEIKKTEAKIKANLENIK